MVAYSLTFVTSSNLYAFSRRILSRRALRASAIHCQLIPPASFDPDDLLGQYPDGGVMITDSTSHFKHSINGVTHSIVQRRPGAPYLPASTPFRSIGNRTKSKISTFAKFLRSYLSRHHVYNNCYFLTLTLSKQTLTDRQHNAILTKFLNNLVKRGVINHYIWRAETQKRGAIHWHVLFLTKFRDEAFAQRRNKRLYMYQNLSMYIYSYWQRINYGSDGYRGEFIQLKKLSSGGAAKYLAKYAGKDSDSERRYLTCRNFGSSRVLGTIIKGFVVPSQNNAVPANVYNYDYCSVPPAFSIFSSCFSRYSIHLTAIITGILESQGCYGRYENYEENLQLHLQTPLHYVALGLWLSGRAPDKSVFSIF